MWTDLESKHFSFILEPWGLSNAVSLSIRTLDSVYFWRKEKKSLSTLKCTNEIEYILHVLAYLMKGAWGEKSVQFTPKSLTISFGVFVEGKKQKKKKEGRRKGRKGEKGEIYSFRSFGTNLLRVRYPGWNWTQKKRLRVGVGTVLTEDLVNSRQSLWKTKCQKWGCTITDGKLMSQIWTVSETNSWSLIILKTTT